VRDKDLFTRNWYRWSSP